MKIKKSKVLIIVACLFIFIPSMMAVLFYLARHPELMSKMGLIGAKAEIFGQGDWSSYMILILQLMAGIGLIGFGFITTWIFGREYAEKTMNDLLALPISRSNIVVAKLLMATIICLFISIIMFAVAIAGGLLVNIEGWDNINLILFGKKYFTIAVLTTLLSPVVSFFTCYGKGYMLSFGFIVFTMILAQISGVVGMGPYFPWSIPGMFSISEPTEGMILTRTSYFILFITSAAGTIGTLLWWQYADHK